MAAEFVSCWDLKLSCSTPQCLGSVFGGRTHMQRHCSLGLDHFALASGLCVDKENTDSRHVCMKDHYNSMRVRIFSDVQWVFLNEGWSACMGRSQPGNRIGDHVSM